MASKQSPAANTIPLLLVALFGLSLSAASQYDHTYYVTPNVSSCTNVSGTCQEFNVYFNNPSYYFQSGTEFIFLPGVHLFDLGSMFSIEDIDNIRFVGSDKLIQHSVAEIVKEKGFTPFDYYNNMSYYQSSTIILCINLSALSFSNVANLTLANLTVLNCEISLGNYTSKVYNLLIDGLTVQNSSRFGLFGDSSSVIMRSSFIGNYHFMESIYSIIKDFELQCDQLTQILNCKFITSFVSVGCNMLNASFYGSIIAATTSNNCNSAPVTILEFMGYNLFVQSQILLRYSALNFSGVNNFIQSTITAQYYSTVVFNGQNTFCCNVVTTRGGAIIIGQTSSLVFKPNSNTMFINNTASYGGAIYIIDPSFSYLQFFILANVSFINNTAFIQGGAIYAGSNTCFYLLECTDIDGVHLYFEGNYAGDAGSVLYGGNIDTCIIDSCSNNSTYVFTQITEIGYHNPSTSLISSDSPCLYSCIDLVCLTGRNVTVYPGQIVEVTFITVGQMNGIVPTLLSVYFDNRVINVFKTLKQCSSYEIPYENENGTRRILLTEGALNSINSYSLDIIVLPCPAMTMPLHCAYVTLCYRDTTWYVVSVM